MSPMLSDDTLHELSSDIEFVSFDGECREAIAWFGGGGNEVTARKVETGDVLRRSPTTRNRQRMRRITFSKPIRRPLARTAWEHFARGMMQKRSAILTAI